MVMAVKPPMKTFEVVCVRCGETVFIKAYVSDLIDWKEGKLIQDALPYLDSDEREILISKTCGDCFDELFGENGADWD